MAKITYENKVALNENPEIADINKVKDTDMNEIKEAVNTNENKILLAISDTAPSTCATGDLYYNTTSKKIFEATGTNTWGTTGTNPTSNTIYILFDTKTTYSYDGTDLVSVGGGGAEISVSTTEPTGEDADSVKLWINPNEAPSGSLNPISNTYGVAQDKGYSQEYLNNQLENKQNGTWTLLQDNVGMNTDVDLSNIDFNELYVVIRHTTDTALAITQTLVKNDLTDTIKWYRNGYYYTASVNSAVAVRASLTKVNFTDYYVNGSLGTATMNVYYR